MQQKQKILHDERSDQPCISRPFKSSLSLRERGICRHLPHSSKNESDNDENIFGSNADPKMWRKNEDFSTIGGLPFPLQRSLSVASKENGHTPGVHNSAVPAGSERRGALQGLVGCSCSLCERQLCKLLTDAMRISITHKLAFPLIAAAVLIVIAMGSAARFSFNKGLSAI